MPDTNITVQSGRLVKDAEILTTQSGSQLCKLTLVQNQYNRSKNENEPHYFDWSYWGKSDKIIQYLTKGRQVILTGYPVQDKWSDKEGKNRSKINFITQNIDIIWDKKQNSQQSTQQSQQPNSQSEYEDDNNIPF